MKWCGVQSSVRSSALSGVRSSVRGGVRSGVQSGVVWYLKRRVLLSFPPLLFRPFPLVRLFSFRRLYRLVSFRLLVFCSPGGL